VTSAEGHFHGTVNAYAAGPALFPTIGSPNPMLTGIALVRRLGDHLIPEPPVASKERGFTPLFDGSQALFADWRMAGAGSFRRAGRSLVAELNPWAPLFVAAPARGERRAEVLVLQVE
jgi:hypothetical protein